MANMEAPKVRKIPMGVGVGPAPRLDPNDQRLDAQTEAEMREDPGYRSSSTVDRPAGPRGYARGGKVVGRSPSTTNLGGGHTVHNYCAGGKVISSKNY